MSRTREHLHRQHTHTRNETGFVRSHGLLGNCGVQKGMLVWIRVHSPQPRIEKQLPDSLPHSHSYSPKEFKAAL